MYYVDNVLIMPRISIPLYSFESINVGGIYDFGDNFIQNTDRYWMKGMLVCCRVCKKDVSKRVCVINAFLNPLIFSSVVTFCFITFCFQ